MVIRVRESDDEEGNELRRIVRDYPSAIQVKRAQVTLASAQGFTPPKIATLTLMNEDYVRTLITPFNLHGFKLLEPQGGLRRPTRSTEAQRKARVDLALSRPKDLGPPFPQGSLSRLCEEGVNRGVIDSISEE